MTLPSNDKQAGDLGHADDHNAIVDEINSLIAASVNYLPVSASSNYLQVSNASATYAKLVSPAFTGTPLAPTAASGTNTTQIATTEFVTSAVLAAQSGSVDLSSYLTTTNASATYLPISASSNYLQVSNASATYLLQSVALNTYLPISSSSNYLPTSASSNYLPTSASNNFATSTISINAQTGTSYTLVLSDSGKIIEMNNAAANLIIIPLNSSVPFPIGTQIEVVQTGAGATSASIVSGVTLNSEAGKRTINAQWQGASLIKRGTDTWIMMGAIKA